MLAVLTSKQMKLVVCLLAGFLAGCGEEGVPVEVQEKPPTDEIRAVLQEISETGTVGSAGYTLREELEKLKETDPAKAEQLSQQLTELERLENNEPAVKAKAEEMAKSL